MNILELISLLEEELENSPNVAFSGNKKKVDMEIIDEIIEKMRQSLPEEVRQAEMIRKEKQAILDDARIQSEAMVRDAERRAKDMVDDNEITRMATTKGEEIINRSQQSAREIRMGAKAYAEDVLNDLERYCGDYIDAIRRNRESLSAKSAQAGQVSQNTGQLRD